MTQAGVYIHVVHEHDRYFTPQLSPPQLSKLFGK